MCILIHIVSFDDNNKCKIKDIKSFRIFYHRHVKSFMIINRFHNMKRTEWNKKCKTRLSEHICKTLSFFSIKTVNTWQNDRLRIVVDASQIRLKINSDNFYAWQKQKKKEHLFIKNLNDLSIRQFKELWKNINKFFVAVRKFLIQIQPKTEFEEDIV